MYGACLKPSGFVFQVQQMWADWLTLWAHNNTVRSTARYGTTSQIHVSASVSNSVPKLEKSAAAATVAAGGALLMIHSTLQTGSLVVSLP